MEKYILGTSNVPISVAAQIGVAGVAVTKIYLLNSAKQLVKKVAESTAETPNISPTLADDAPNLHTKYFYYFTTITFPGVPDDIKDTIINNMLVKYIVLGGSDSVKNYIPTEEEIEIDPGNELVTIKKYIKLI